MYDVWRVARAEGRKRARHRAAPIEEIQRKRDYATCAAAALPSNVKNFFSFAIRMIIYCCFVVFKNHLVPNRSVIGRSLTKCGTKLLQKIGINTAVRRDALLMKGKRKNRK